jgi:hypothetical protein
MFFFFNLPAAFCDEDNQEIDTEALIELLLQKGVISEKEADALKTKVKKPKPAAPDEQQIIYIVPDDQEQKIVEEVKAQTKEDVQRVDEKIDRKTEDISQRQRLTERQVQDLEENLNELNDRMFKSEWAQRIRFGGDVRLRYQGDFYDKNNAILLDPNDPDELLNTTEDRDRFRFRMRLAVDAIIIDPRDKNVGKVNVGIRLVTGNERVPVSTNDTLGDYFNKDGIVIDRAYLRYTYQPAAAIWGNKIPRLQATGGRIPNPWFYTDLLWDHDLNFEGADVNLLSDSQDFSKWSAFLTLGAFPMQEIEFSQNDKWLFGGQVGFTYQPSFDYLAKIGFAYYDYMNVEGQLNDPARPGEKDFTAPLFLQKGNTLFDIDPGPGIKPALASDYDLINLTAKFDIGIYHPIHILLIGNVVENIGFDQDKVEARTGQKVDKETFGWHLGMEVGHPVILEFNDWNLFLAYKYIEADAVLDAFTDSYFHGGGTNAKGWIIGGDYGLYRDVWFRVRWMTSDEISGPKLAIDTLQMDVNARF